jgi:hypothetical protein
MSGKSRRSFGTPTGAVDNSVIKKTAGFNKRSNAICCKILKKLVGASGFEPPTSCPEPDGEDSAEPLKMLYF